MRTSVANSAMHDGNEAIRMAMFFTHGVSLQTWDSVGLFDREVGYYQALSREIGPIRLVSYDRPNPGLDGLLTRIKPLAAVYNRWRLPYPVFGLLAPVLHRKTLRRCLVFKSNQLSGAWTAAIAARLYKKPLVVRCGYVKSSFEAREGVSAARLRRTLFLERASLRAAARVFVATPQDRDYLASTHGISPDLFHILPTPIDTERFCPNPESQRQPGTVVFVGRFNRQKNLHLLIEACRRLPGTRLVFVGSGELEQELREQAVGCDVQFTGNVANYELPKLLNAAEVFAMPSSYEGSPKAFLEAMACGLAMIGTDVPGIRTVIQHGVNGLLCKPDVESLSSALGEILADEGLRFRLGTAARNHVLERCSQAAVVRTEARILSSLIDNEAPLCPLNT